MRSLAIMVAFFIWTGSAFANVIYEFREVGSTQVIGTIAIKSPPASVSMGWGALDQNDLSAFLLSDGFFGLGSGNLLSAGSLGFGGVASVDGLELEGGNMQIDFPAIAPPDPLIDPSIHKNLSLSFDPLNGADLIALSTLNVFPDGTMLVGDLFLSGDWVVQSVPEPSGLALLGTGLFLLGCVRYRKQPFLTRF